MLAEAAKLESDSSSEEFFAADDEEEFEVSVFGGFRGVLRDETKSFSAESSRFELEVEVEDDEDEEEDCCSTMARVLEGLRGLGFGLV